MRILDSPVWSPAQRITAPTMPSQLHRAVPTPVNLPRFVTVSLFAGARLAGTVTLHIVRRFPGASVDLGRFRRSVAPSGGHDSRDGLTLRFIARGRDQDQARTQPDAGQRVGEGPALDKSVVG